MGSKKSITPMPEVIKYMVMGIEKGIVWIGKEVGVFEIKEYTQIHDHTGGKPQFSFLRIDGSADSAAHQVIPDGSEEKK